ARNLPDVAGDAARAARPLEWVGMDRIALPLRIAGEDGAAVLVPASVDLAVDLRSAEARGTDMSRLCLRLLDAVARGLPGQPRLRRVRRDSVDSPQGLSARARLTIRCGRLLRRPGLASGHSAWKTSPVELVAELGDGELDL